MAHFRFPICQFGGMNRTGVSFFYGSSSISSLYREIIEGELENLSIEALLEHTSEARDEGGKRKTIVWKRMIEFGTNLHCGLGELPG